MEGNIILIAAGLKPVQAVECPRSGYLVAVEECRACECCVELRQPWRYWAVKCSFPGAESTAVYQ